MDVKAWRIQQQQQAAPGIKKTVHGIQGSGFPLTIQTARNGAQTARPVHTFKSVGSWALLWRNGSML